jgi:Na+-driven multidrug efflux pump
LVEVIKAGIPTILSLIFFQMIGLLNVWFIGQLGNVALLGGVGMGTMLLNVFCFALAFGLNGSIETFVARDYGNQEF